MSANNNKSNELLLATSYSTGLQRLRLANNCALPTSTSSVKPISAVTITKITTRTKASIVSVTKEETKITKHGVERATTIETKQVKPV